MPRKQYRADLAAASTVPDYGHITAVGSGEDDGDCTFLFTEPSNGKRSQVTANVDTSEYPSSHNYQFYAADDASEAVANALQNCPPLSGRPLQEALLLLSAYLVTQTATGGIHDLININEDSDVDTPDSQAFPDHSEDDTEEGENEDWALEDDDFTEATGLTNRGSLSGADMDIQDSDESLLRARADLRAVKAAGFKVGVLGKLSQGNACYVSVACRISKLGISEEAQDAWMLGSSEYLILLLYFPHGYRSLEFFESIDYQNGRSRLTMGIGIGDTYKPRSVAEAQRAFCASSDNNENYNTSADGNKGFRECFISKPLSDLLNERLTTIMKYRLAMAFPWGGAERYYKDNIGASRFAGDYANAQYAAPEVNPPGLPSIVFQDEITTPKTTEELSFPLAAMQFLLRHFVRCTDFCLVCHSPLASEIEAIKPYVCDTPLCLYQYMDLGFGPSIEHEIISQPYVVDILVSFCYASAFSTNLSSYPDGLDIDVPDPSKAIGGATAATQGQVHAYHAPPPPTIDPAKKENRTLADLTQLSAQFDNTLLELLFADAREKCPLKHGQWIVMNPDHLPDESWHCKVIETHLFPVVRVTEPVIIRLGEDPKVDEEEKGRLSGWTKVHLHAYDRKIGSLGKEDMCTIIMMLLELLPTVREMKTYLESKPGATLSQWKGRISKAALGVLRWIIASNRSCIMQVDRLDEDATSSKKPEERVAGLSGWLQFRFAMGAPDKEQRFITSIASETGGSQHPTLFAWHGSPMQNWHSIIREGLHFGKTSHGRAYGHGCYHAKDFGTSGGYSGIGYGARSGTRTPGTWSKSILKIGQAIALSEIVNAPEKYVSNIPYYVVAQLDWIQTRYLFVHPEGQLDVKEVPITGGAFEQDPARTPTGPNHQKIQLPLSAIPKSRRKATIHSGAAGAVEDSPIASPRSKRPAKGTGVGWNKVAKLTSDAMKTVTGRDRLSSTYTSDDDAASVDTEPEDLKMLLEPPEDMRRRPAIPPPDRLRFVEFPSEPCTPFHVKAITNLPLTPSPTYATNQATKRLQKDFRTLLATQEKHIQAGTLSDLGFYVDPNHITANDNLYQWIAELHSFPLTLPLAQDLQKVGMQSVVLEIRFHATYPMSPPFVRVVRPRFLPFASGGGGHVTLGGSICAQLLTNDGWTVVSDMESVFLQIRMAIMSLEPKPARIESVVHGARGGRGIDYGVGEAVNAFKRVCAVHGWKVPEGLNEIAAAAVPGQMDGLGVGP